MVHSEEKSQSFHQFLLPYNHCLLVIFLSYQSLVDLTTLLYASFRPLAGQNVQRPGGMSPAFGTKCPSRDGPSKINSIVPSPAGNRKSLTAPGPTRKSACHSHKENGKRRLVGSIFNFRMGKARLGVSNKFPFGFQAIPLLLSLVLFAQEKSPFFLR